MFSNKSTANKKCFQTSTLSFGSRLLGDPLQNISHSFQALICGQFLELIMNLELSE